MQADNETRFDAKAGTDAWFLEGYIGAERLLRRFVLEPGATLRVGRRECLEISIPDQTVSSLHAELRLDGSCLKLRDLGSSNGTFVNRCRLTGEAELTLGDAVHFCRNEFRVGRFSELEQIPIEERTTRTAIRPQALPGDLAGGRELVDMMERRRLRTVFQPIAHIRDGQPFGYEMLGRSGDPRLVESPLALIRIAESLGAAAKLSSLFRDIGLESARLLPGSPNIFFNTHPSELADSSLLDNLAQVRRVYPELALTLEVHESAVTDGAAMRELRARLADIDIALAYDDFGAGESRLMMVADAPPDFLKFDMSLVRGIDLASDSRRRLLHGLLDNVRELGVTCVAEGVETEGELCACRELGFHLVQGYHIGRPAPVERWMLPDVERPTLRMPRSASLGLGMDRTMEIPKSFMASLCD